MLKRLYLAVPVLKHLYLAVPVLKHLYIASRKERQTGTRESKALEGFEKIYVIFLNKNKR